MSSLDVPHLLTDAQLHRVFRIAEDVMLGDGHGNDRDYVRYALVWKCELYEGIRDIPEEVLDLAVRSAGRSYLAAAKGAFECAEVPYPFEEEEAE